MNICYIVAMQAEAQPFIDHYGVEEIKDFFAPLPCKLYTTKILDSTLNIVLNGQQHGTGFLAYTALRCAGNDLIQF